MPNAAEVAAARQVLEATDLGNPEALTAVEAIRFSPAGLEAARAILASSASGDVLWAAAWVYATSATDPTLLMPLLSNQDASLRAIAGAALLSLGRSEAVHVLTDLLSATGNLAGAAPPLLVSDFAAYSLGRYIDGPAIAATATPAEVTAAWTSWLAANEASMQFDTEIGKWRAR